MKLLLLGHGGVKVSKKEIENEMVEGEVGALAKLGQKIKYTK